MLLVCFMISSVLFSKGGKIFCARMICSTDIDGLQSVVGLVSGLVSRILSCVQDCFDSVPRT